MEDLTKIVKLPGHVDFDNADYVPDENQINKYQELIQRTHTTRAGHMSRYSRRYDNREGIEEHDSFLFKKGERLLDSLLTIEGPGFENRYHRMTWMFVKCRCICGTELLIKYVNAYQNPPYSCGCKVRLKKNAIDYTGEELARNGRTLTILERTDAGDWKYICSCCAEIFLLRRGGVGTIRAKLLAVARQPCPNAQPKP